MGDHGGIEIQSSEMDLAVSSKERYPSSTFVVRVVELHIEPGNI